jgi:MFS family permease
VDGHLQAIVIEQPCYEDPLHRKSSSLPACLQNSRITGIYNQPVFYWHFVLAILLHKYSILHSQCPPGCPSVGTGRPALEAGIFLFEIPTGMVADLYSRRLSVIIGTAVIGLGTLLTGLTPNFFLILTGQIIWGVGFTFTSGALDAWISDEIGMDNATTAYLRGSQSFNLGAVVGISLCAVISLAG